MGRPPKYRKTGPLPLPGTTIEKRTVKCLAQVSRDCRKEFRTLGYLYKSGRWVAQYRTCSVCRGKNSRMGARMGFQLARKKRIREGGSDD